MSSDLYYPQLRDLEQRRDQLVNDVASIHRRLVLRSESFEEADTRLFTFLKAALQRKGLNSARELIDSTLNLMDDEKRSAFETILGALQDAYLNYDVPISYFLVLPHISARASIEHHLSVLVDSAALYTAARLSAKAVVLSTSGTALSLRDAAKVAAVASAIYDTLKDHNMNPVIEFGLRVNRDAPDFSNVPAPQIITAVNGAAQVRSLQSDINVFFRKRLNLELVDNLCTKSVTLTGQLDSALSLVSKMIGVEAVDFSLQSAVDILVAPFVDEIDSVWDSGTIESAAAAWIAADKERSSYIEDDPSLEDVIQELSL